MNSPLRHISFFVPDLGGFETQEVEGEAEIRTGSGKPLGTFPRTGSERFSWYLCGCESDPTARRATGPTDFACLRPDCDVESEAVLICACGVVSPVDQTAECPWCGRAASGEPHACRGTGDERPVFYNLPICPLCAPSSAKLPTLAPATVQPPEDPTAEGPARAPVEGADDHGLATSSEASSEASAEAARADREWPEGAYRWDPIAERLLPADDDAGPFFVVTRTPGEGFVARPDAVERRPADDLVWIEWLFEVDVEDVRGRLEIDRPVRLEARPNGLAVVERGRATLGVRDVLPPSPPQDLELPLGETTITTPAPGKPRRVRGVWFAALAVALAVLATVLLVLRSQQSPPPPPSVEATDLQMANPALEEREAITLQPQPDPEAGEPAPDVPSVPPPRPLSEEPDPPPESTADDEAAATDEAALVETGEIDTLRTDLERAIEAEEWTQALAAARQIAELSPDEPEIDRTVELLELRQEFAAPETRQLEIKRRQLANRILELDPNDRGAQALRSEKRDRAVRDSLRAAERGDEDRINAIWNLHDRNWPNDPASQAAREAALRAHAETVAERIPDERAPDASETASEEASPEPEDDPAAPEAEAESGVSSPDATPAATKSMLGFARINADRRVTMGCTPSDPMCGQFERPSRKVTISRNYQIGTTETTNRAYGNCVAAGVCRAPDSREFSDPSKLEHPVTRVGYDDATTFCRWIGGRLPTEAEWEWAARGLREGDSYPWGRSIDKSRANFEGTGQLDRWAGTAPVASFPPDRRGVYDMAGNVAEWVSDWFGAYSKRDTDDPEGPPTGRLRVVRGGAWDDSADELRVSARKLVGPTARTLSTGFRCVLP